MRHISQSKSCDTPLKDENITIPGSKSASGPGRSESLTPPSSCWAAKANLLSSASKVS